MSDPDTDVIIVGSGASGVHAATALVDAGLRVRTLDLGNRETHYDGLIPPASFSEIRHRDPEQHRYFLGERFEGVSFAGVGTGTELTPPRQFVEQDAAELLPIDSEGFSPIQSLALGGLAGAWGAGCPPFVDEDLEGFPIGYSDLAPHYEAVAERIGVSGASDDLTPFLGDLRAMQPAARADTNAAQILSRYQAKRRALNHAGFHLGRPRLALLSNDHRGRSATRYHDMDYWSDHGKSVYRPRWTVEELSSRANFEYLDRQLVESFKEHEDGTVEVRAVEEGERRHTHRARALVLAAGTLGTARIVLSSLRRFDRPLPLVCNPHTYAPMVNLRMLGRSADDRRHSLAQLCYVWAPAGRAGGTTVGHVYSYRSLLNFRLVRESPLCSRHAAEMVRLLLPSFTIVLMQHADQPTESKRCLLRSGSEAGARLEVHYSLSAEEEGRIERVEREIALRFRKLGCLCIRRVAASHGASAHYAGTFPMTTAEDELTTEPTGRLRGTGSVYLVDGSVFPRLPSKGLTFSMMANADRIGTKLGQVLSG